MPFKSAKQRAYLYANEPEVAKSFAKKHMDKNKDGKINTKDFKLMKRKSGGKTSKFKDGDDTHVTKDGRTVKKGLYYYMNKRKNSGTSRKGKGTVSDKALKQSKKTAHHSK